MSERPSRRSRRAADPRGDVATPVRRGRLSYANVTASVALFVALGGTSYAAIKLPAKSVGTIQLKSRAVTKAKIAPGAVDGSKVRNGSLTGADIAAGAVDGSKVRDGSLSGADIAGKVPAAVTADMLANVQRIVVPAASEPASGSSTIKTITATCPAGTFVVGGGANLSDQYAQLVNDSYPSSTTAWTADVFNDSPSAPGFTVYAICVPAAAS
jgi:hypothetical protein